MVNHYAFSLILVHKRRSLQTAEITAQVMGSALSHIA